VVDDDPDALDILCTVLETEGATVDCADSATHALARFGAHATSYDVVISDLAMPQRDGIWLLQQIRKWSVPRYAAFRAIALTGHVHPDVRRAALEAGFDSFLAKPFNLPELRRAVLGQAGY
jgi:two-component system CheB/CheR fusion protein